MRCGLKQKKRMLLSFVEYFDGNLHEITNINDDDELVLYMMMSSGLTTHQPMRVICVYVPFNNI